LTRGRQFPSEYRPSLQNYFRRPFHARYSFPDQRFGKVRKAEARRRGTAFLHEIHPPIDPPDSFPYFKSVLIRGTASIMDDLEEKAKVLTALMEKLQPEGGYDPIDPADPAYVPRIHGVAVVAITPDSITAKFKFGQNLPETRARHIRGRLAERNEPLDAETAELMARYCPAHRERT
jgi:hypothetical protein